MKNLEGLEVYLKIFAHVQLINYFNLVTFFLTRNVKEKVFFLPITFSTIS